MKKHIRTILALMCLVACLFTLTTANAAVIDPAQRGSIRLNLVYDGSGVAGVTFSIYRVASMNDEAQFVLLDGWETDADLLHISGAAAWSAFAQSMAEQTTGKTPDASSETLSDGHITFTDLPVGLYLVMGEPKTLGDLAYVFSPVMVSLPNKNADGAYNFAVAADVKFEVTFLTTDLKVMKVWDDSGYSALRPVSIEVDLYCDGVVNETIELNRDNDWQHEFLELPRMHVYVLVEHEVPDGYNVSYTKPDDTTTVITNTVVATPTPTPPIPQTGLNWWPVPLLACAGLLMFVLGVVAHRKWRHEHEES